MPHLFRLLLPLLIASSASAVSMEWTAVGQPGNACDPQSDGCYGAVGYAYQIGTYEVTNAQYAEFLNAVAVDDANGLYHEQMAGGDPGFPISSLGGISRSGASGSYSYDVLPGRADLPVNFVSYFNAARFVNWIHNGQPSGSQDAATTEDGAYTFSNAFVVGGRNPGATVFLPTQDEWYKAAYYDAESASYFDYPAGSNTQIVCATPGAIANTANCAGVIPADRSFGDLSPVGSYAASASPSGSFDQGGNVWEWSDTRLPQTTLFPHHIVRGGDFEVDPSLIAASNWGFADASIATRDLGFRLAMIPEPGTGLLVIAGLLALAGGRPRT